MKCLAVIAAVLALVVVGCADERVRTLEAQIERLSAEVESLKQTPVLPTPVPPSLDDTMVVSKWQQSSCHGWKSLNFTCYTILYRFNGETEGYTLAKTDLLSGGDEARECYEETGIGAPLPLCWREGDFI